VSDKKIYGFKHFRSYLEKRKYVFKERKDFKIIKRILTPEFERDNILYENNGIYLLLKGVKYQGYLSLRERDLTNYPELPKFHVVECATIRQQKENNTFDNRYFWSNSKFIDITDSSTGEVRKKQNLDLCKNCGKILREVVYSNTFEFSEELANYNLKLQSEEIKLNSNNRPFDWNRMSKAYRISKNYKCEKCNYDGSVLRGLDKGYMEVDHIIAWELSNLNEENLQCLCVLCHSQKDPVHQKNYSKGANLKKVKEFVKKFKSELMECNNPYIIDFNLKHPEL
jgi:hypothetical protein